MPEKGYLKFYEMDIWKDAFELQKEIFILTKTFPKHERYGLSGQMDDASNSVCANIAECHGRYHFADKIRVLYIVRGEIEETQSHLLIAESRSYITTEIMKHLAQRYEQLKIKINNTILDYRQRKNNE